MVLRWVVADSDSDNHDVAHVLMQWCLFMRASKLMVSLLNSFLNIFHAEGWELGVLSQSMVVRCITISFFSFFPNRQRAFARRY